MPVDARSRTRSQDDQPRRHEQLGEARALHCRRRARHRPALHHPTQSVPRHRAILQDADDERPHSRPPKRNADPGHGHLYFHLSVLRLLLRSRASADVCAVGLFRTLGGTVGISIGQAIFTSIAVRLPSFQLLKRAHQLVRKQKQRLRQIPNYDPNMFGGAAALQTNVGALRSLEPPELRTQVIHAYSVGIQYIWIVAVALNALGFIASATFAFPVRDGADGTWQLLG